MERIVKASIKPHTATTHAVSLRAFDEIESRMRAAIAERLIRAIKEEKGNPLDAARRATRDVTRMYRALNALSDIVFDTDD